MSPDARDQRVQLDGAGGPGSGRTPTASLGFRFVSWMMEAVAWMLRWRWHTTGVEWIQRSHPA